MTALILSIKMFKRKKNQPVRRSTFISPLEGATSTRKLCVTSGTSDSERSVLSSLKKEKKNKLQ